MPSVANVMLVSVLFFLLFSILGVSYFNGSFYHCSMELAPATLIAHEIETQQDCLDLSGVWENKDSHFDNTLNGMLTLFVISTTEGWLDIMYSGVDAVGPRLEPEFEHNIWFFFLFMIFVLFGNLLMINLLVGVVTTNFNAVNNIERGDAFLT
jgi:hypothetical protein